MCPPEERGVCGGVVCLCVCEDEVRDRVPVYLLYVFVYFSILTRSTNGNFIRFVLKCACAKTRLMCGQGIVGYQSSGNCPKDE